MIVITIKTDNAAFEGCDKWGEVGRILEEIASHCVDFEPNGRYRDINGNPVCTVKET